MTLPVCFKHPVCACLKKGALDAKKYEWKNEVKGRLFLEYLDGDWRSVYHFFLPGDYDINF